MLATVLLAATLETWVPSQVGNYLEAYFRTFPSKATEAGRHDLDARLESLPVGKRAEWLEFKRTVHAWERDTYLEKF